MNDKTIYGSGPNPKHFGIPPGTEGGRNQEDTQATKLARALQGDREFPTASKTHLISLGETGKPEPRGTETIPRYAGVDPSDPVYLSAQYPYVKIQRSESGHIDVIDDTLGGERLLKQHKTGTYEEYLPNGDKSVMVVGDGYEVIAGKKSIFINAAGRGDREDGLVITVNGNVRQLVKGDYVLEVEGDYHEKVHGNKFTKIGAGIGGNHKVEIRGNYSEQINEDYKSRITGNYDATIEKNRTTLINGNDSLAVVEDISLISTTGNLLLFAIKNVSISANDSAAGIISLKAAGVVDIRSVGQTNIVAGTILDLDSGGGSPTSTNRINLN